MKTSEKPRFPWSGFGNRILIENGVYGVIGWLRNSRFQSEDSKYSLSICYSRDNYIIILLQYRYEVLIIYRGESAMQNIPDSLFDIDVNDVEIGVGEIHLFSEDEINEAQTGYRFDANGNAISDWIGDNFVVIGHDSSCGDPIIADTSDDNFPIYTMFHDDWSSKQIIASSFKDFLNILKLIQSSKLNDEASKNALLANISTIAPKENQSYWESMLQAAYDFHNDN